MLLFVHQASACVCDGGPQASQQALISWAIMCDNPHLRILLSIISSSKRYQETRHARDVQTIRRLLPSQYSATTTTTNSKRALLIFIATCNLLNKRHNQKRPLSTTNIDDDNDDDDGKRPLQLMWHTQSSLLLTAVAASQWRFHSVQQSSVSWTN